CAREDDYDWYFDVW
nr:immunoglobulin heavy chain junction region [Mus musculus]